MSRDVRPRLPFSQECAVLKGSGFNQAQAAEHFGYNRRTLIAKLKKEGTAWRDLDPLTPEPVSASQSDLTGSHSPPDSPPPPQPSRRRGSNTAAPAHIPQSEHLSEEFLEQYLIYLAQHGDPSPQIASQIASFLDKKKMLQPTQELDESNQYLSEFEDIQNAVFTADPAPDCVPIDS